MDCLTSGSSDTQSALFFLAPYSATLEQMKLPIHLLERAGHLVLPYEFPRSIIRNGNPEDLVTAVADTRTDIRSNVDRLAAQGVTDFGFVGSSVGSLIVYNCLDAIPEFKWGVLNTGGNVARAIWRFEAERLAFVEKGYSETDLADAWYDIQYPALGDLSGKRYLITASTADDVIDMPGTLEILECIRAAGPEVTLLTNTNHRLNHRRTVIYNLLRMSRLVKKVQRP